MYLISAEENPYKERKNLRNVDAQRNPQLFPSAWLLVRSKFTVMIACLDPQAQKPIDVKKIIRKSIFTAGGLWTLFRK